MKPWLVCLFVVALGLRIPHIGGPLRWEERDLVPGLRDISLSPRSFYLPPKVGDHTPLAVIAAWPLYRMAPHDPWVLRVPSLLAGALIPVLVAWSLWRWANPAAGLVAGLLAASNNFLIAWSAYFMQEMLYLLFGIVGFMLVLRAEYRRSTVEALGAAALLALSFWTHEFALLLAPMAGLYLLASSQSRRWLRTPGPWVAVLLWGILIMPYFAWNLGARERFATLGGISIAQQHIASTVLAKRAINGRFMEFLIGGGLSDIRKWPRFELNHVDPAMGAILLAASAACLITHRANPLVRLCLVAFWFLVAVFSFIDLEFRIYRFSLCLVTGCVMAGVVLGGLWRRKRLRPVVMLILCYALVSGAMARPCAGGAAHEGFRWWGKGPLFQESSLIDTVVAAQRSTPASLILMPAPFWDHIPLRLEYEAGARCVGGSREMIYGSTFLMRPYRADEACAPRIVVSCQEDVMSWWEFMQQNGYETSMTRHDMAFAGALEDTLFPCPVFFIDGRTDSPPPVQIFLDQIYRR
ncbi:glycosyltransferase family 39 protein [Candidatus Fermentibacteria bacterium]|nr:glycosyltransferase family 39 protein [Candidatus Fermentibacteria bacterium]